MSILGKTFLALLLIPFLTLALEPSNPKTICDRFLGEKDQASCDAKMKKDDVDWYAATVCSLTEEDLQFWKCWESIKGAHFSPEAIEPCAQNSKLKDEERISCIQKAKLDRSPASLKKEFQPLIIKKSH